MERRRWRLAGAARSLLARAVGEEGDGGEVGYWPGWAERESWTGGQRGERRRPEKGLRIFLFSSFLLKVNKIQ